jgi:two-component system nitrogen regulation sensor histidine kinase NtrY
MSNYFFYLSIFLIFLILPIYTLYVIRRNNFINPISLKKQILNHIFAINIFITLITVVYIIYFLKTGFLIIRNSNIENVLKNSYMVSEAYHQENKEKISNDALIIARTLSSQSLDFFENKEQIQILIESYSSLKELSEIVVFVPSQNLILAKNNLSFSLVFDSIPSSYLFEAGKERPVIIENLNYSKIRALIELEGFPSKTYLMISRYLDAKIVNYLLESKDAVNSYEKIKQNITKMQNIFLSVFFVTILASIFVIRFLTKIISNQVIGPINDFVLIASKEGIENVDLKSIKNKKTNILELNILIDAFNSIIEKLNNSKKEIDEHNRFINAIFSQTPYGLFVFDSLNSKIIMQNDATDKLLFGSMLHGLSNFKNLFLNKIKNLFLTKNKDLIEESIDLTDSSSGKIVTFLVKIIKGDFSYLEKEKDDQGKYFLVIFNDITEHIAFQRNLLWIDVAKRITHEIRNPLTPILLSVERLEYKFSEQIAEAKRENFCKYLENIKRHTLTISNIIDEFVEFGKMPEPEFHQKDLNKIILETIEGAYFDKKMSYNLDLFQDRLEFLADEKQIMRMLLNIFKNSHEAFSQQEDKDSLEIRIKTFSDEDQNIVLQICDNGPGFPPHLIEKMTEPYVTTKKKGSGLGLSIVKRIVGDHNGQISFENLFDQDKKILGTKIVVCFLKRD